VLLGACLGLGGVRILLGNRLTFWLAAISYQVYMWHQMIALQMKKWGFPPSVNPEPHMAGERAWQLGYTLMALALTLLIATAVTYLIERPLSERARKKT
jgi:peptidoglycan/LPS O-acetylase OafA/YrhL